MHNFKAQIKLPNGLRQSVTIQADNAQKAKAMLEAQYGLGSIVVGPNREY